jgi:hypothetical protein
MASGEGIEPPPSAFEARRSSARAAPIWTPHRDSDPGLRAGGVPSCLWTMRGCTTGRTRTSVAGFGIRCPGRWTTVIEGLCDRADIAPGRRSDGRRDRCSGMPPRPNGEGWWGAQDSNLVPSLKRRMHRRVCLHPRLRRGDLEGSAAARWPLPRLDNGTPRSRSLLPCLKDRCIAPMLASRPGMRWTRRVESDHEPAGLRPAPSAGRFGSGVGWRLQRESHPRSQIDNLVSCCWTMEAWKRSRGAACRRGGSSTAGGRNGCGCGTCTHLHGL